MILRLASTFFALVLASCAYREDVTAIHPYRESLLGPSKTTKTLYLHDEGKDGYFALTSKTVGYQTQSDGSQIATHYPADMTLPAGTTVIVERIDFGGDMTFGTHTKLIGRALPRGSDPVRIFTLHELLRIDQSQWQKEHGFLSSPSAEDYLKLSKEPSPRW